MVSLINTVLKGIGGIKKMSSVDQLTVAVIAGYALSYVVGVVSDYMKVCSDNAMEKKLKEVDLKLQEVNEKLKEIDYKIAEKMIEVDEKTEGVNGLRKIVVSSAPTSKGNYKTLGSGFSS